jgi:hypothetical protein
MPKSRSRKDANLRSHIAYLAARLMAEDGVADYGAAKQKAARQAGLQDTNLLPDNQEIEAALRDYHALYQATDQPAQLRRMREVAVRVMREFSEFRPALVGSVLTGTANKFSDVNLQLFTDDSKALTLFLLNRRYRYEEGARRVRRGDSHVEVPQILLEIEGIPVTMTVLDRDDERLSGRARGEAELQRARLADVEALLGASAPP